MPEAASSRPLVTLALAASANVVAAAEKSLSAEPQAPTDLQLFLVLGLPNLPPRGTVEKMDRQLHERVRLMNKGLGWAKTIDPEEWSEAELAPVELAAAVAHTAAEGRPGLMFGVIPCAFGGESLTDWRPGSTLYQNAIERARVAQKDGKLTGIFWYQGPTREDPAQARDYAKRFAAMIAQLRADLGIKYVPVIVGEIRPAASGAPKATPLAQVPQEVIPCFFISTEGLRSATESTRLDSKLLWEFTDRFTQAWMDLAQP